MSLKLNERYPGRFNNPSAGYPSGSFKNRTTPDTKDGSYLEKDWANDKEGFFQSILSSAGITANGTVDSVGASQFFDALQALKQIQAGIAFTTIGSAGTLSLAPSPAITAYSANQRFRVKFSQASTGSDTINVSGLGAKNLKQYNSMGAKIPAVFAVGQLANVEYDGTDFVSLNQLPNSSGVTAPQFNISTLLATTAYVQGVGFQFSGLYSFSANATLTAGSHAGSLIIGNSSSAISIALPLAATMPSKTVIRFWNSGAGVLSITCSGSDFISTPTSTASYQLQKGQWASFASTGGGAYYLIDCSPISQLSVTDTTAGALLEVAAFGLGGVSPAFPGADLNNAAVNYGSTWSTSTGCLNIPAGWNAQGSIVKVDSWQTLSARQQTFMEHLTGRMARRVWDGAAWSAWDTIVTLSTGSVLLTNTVGYSKVYVDVTGSRSSGVAYTNTNGYPINVLVTLNTLTAAETTTIVVGGVTIYTGDPGVGSQQAPISFIVPNGATYGVNVTGSVIQKWVELK